MIRRLAPALLVLMLAAQAHADDVEAAKQHYKEGMRLYDLGRYIEAAKEYEHAFEAKDLPEFLYDAAQAYRLGQDYPAALRFYRSYLRRAPKAPNRDEVEAKIEEVQKAIDQQQKTREAPPQGTMQPPQVNEPTAKTTAPIAQTPAPTKTADAAPLIVDTPAPLPERRPVYKRAWFWGVIGGAAVVVALGVGLGVGLSSNGTSYPSAPTTFGTVRF